MITCYELPFCEAVSAHTCARPFANANLSHRMWANAIRSVRRQLGIQNGNAADVAAPDIIPNCETSALWHRDVLPLALELWRLTTSLASRVSHRGPFCGKKVRCLGLIFRCSLLSGCAASASVPCGSVSWRGEENDRKMISHCAAKQGHRRKGACGSLCTDSPALSTRSTAVKRTADQTRLIDTRSAGLRSACARQILTSIPGDVCLNL